MCFWKVVSIKHTVYLLSIRAMSWTGDISANRVIHRLAQNRFNKKLNKRPSINSWKGIKEHAMRRRTVVFQVQISLQTFSEGDYRAQHHVNRKSSSYQLRQAPERFRESCTEAGLLHTVSDKSDCKTSGGGAKEIYDHWTAIEPIATQW